MKKIESQLFAPEAKVIPMRQWRMAAAATVLLLILNVFSMRQYVQNNALNASEELVVVDNEQSLISNYNLYE